MLYLKRNEKKSICKYNLLFIISGLFHFYNMETPFWNESLGYLIVLYCKFSLCRISILALKKIIIKMSFNVLQAHSACSF